MKKFLTADAIAIDTETNGLYPYRAGAKAFAISLAMDGYTEYRNVTSLARIELLDLVSIGGKTFIFHNAKFDLHFLGVTFGQYLVDTLLSMNKVWDTSVVARLLYNDHMSYSLEACTKRIGLEKINIDAYIKEHKLYETTEIPNKKTRNRRPMYESVPEFVMADYAKRDAEITYKLYLSQKAELETPTEDTPSLTEVHNLEANLVHPLYDMEHNGVRIDEDFCTKSISTLHESTRLDMDKFTDLTKLKYVASAKCFSQVFADQKDKWVYTEKGNPSFDSDTLKRFTGPAADLIIKIRDAKSKQDFLSGFLYHLDDRGYVHPGFNSGGTATGRISSSEPNFQNLSNNDESTKENGGGGDVINVRSAIIPPTPDHCIVALDYEQQEYRLMLDYAGEMDLIYRVGDGLDVHQATAEMMGITRKQAKFTNFGLLYGQGASLLASNLGMPLEEAKELKAKYFARLPGVRKFIQQVQLNAERRGFVFNWLGRRFHCLNKEFSYKMPNRVIQGGGADIMKKAMVEIHKYLTDLKVPADKLCMCMTIHDEIVFYIHKDYLVHIKWIKRIMEEVYPQKHLKMKVSVEHSWENFGAMVEGIPE